jgi:hypothetical protein
VLLFFLTQGLCKCRSSLALFASLQIWEAESGCALLIQKLDAPWGVTMDVVEMEKTNARS